MHRFNQKYSYVQHKDSFPLELNGSSKKKVNSINKEEYQQSRGSLNEESRSVLMKKLSKGKKDFQVNKSVLPGAKRVFFSLPREETQDPVQLECTKIINKTSEPQVSITSCSRPSMQNKSIISKKPISVKATSNPKKSKRKNISSCKTPKPAKTRLKGPS